MDGENIDVFSPVRNFDEEKIKRKSDSFSEFMKVPDILTKKSINIETSENGDENTPINNILNIKSSKTRQKKTAVYKSWKNEEAVASSTSIPDCAFTISSEKIKSIGKDKTKNTSLTSKRNDKLRTNQQSEAEFKNKKKSDSHSAKKNSVNLVKSSLQPRPAIISIATRSKESKKADEPPSVNQRNPLSQIQSEALEKMIKDAVESQVDDIRKSLWSHHLNLLKAIYNVQDEMEKRRSENTTVFKIIEELLEENRLLRTALLAHQ